jgi:hypothetical protein
MAYDDDDDEGPGFLTTAALIVIAAGGAWFLYKTLTGSAAAADLSNLVPGLIPPGGSGVSSPAIPAGAPLGIRNNNPGNIKYSPANNWDGQTGSDANGFATFSDPAYGLRAMFVTLQSYASEISPYTIQTIGQRWTQGDPAASQAQWMATVSAVSGFSQTQTLDPSDAGQMQQLVNGIVAAENGQGYSGFYAGMIPEASQMSV